MDALSPPVTTHHWDHVMNFDGTPVLSLTIRRPSFPSQGKLKRMERYFSCLESQWKKRWTEVLFPQACRALTHAKEMNIQFRPWRAQLDYTITLWQPPLLSLRLDAVETSHDANSHPFCMGETWDCTGGYPCRLYTFLASPSLRRRKNLLDSLKDQAAQQLASGESLLDPDCASKMDHFFDADRFYLTPEHLCIFYPLCTIGAHAEGIPIFTVPFKQTGFLPHPSQPCDDKKQNQAPIQDKCAQMQSAKAEDSSRGSVR